MSLESRIRTFIAKKKYPDMVQLHEQLDYLSIPHEFCQIYDGFHIVILAAFGEPNSNGFAFHTNSIIHHAYSYGLEAMGFGEREVRGYLTVNEAVKMVRDYIKDVENVGFIVFSPGGSDPHG